MIIYDFFYFHTLYFYPLVPAVFIHWNRLLMRFENQSIWLVQVTSPLSFPVLRQLMIVPRQIRDILQRHSGKHLGQPQVEKPRPQIPQLLFPPSVIIGQSLQLLRPKCYIHIFTF